MHLHVHPSFDLKKVLLPCLVYSTPFLVQYMNSCDWSLQCLFRHCLTHEVLIAAFATQKSPSTTNFQQRTLSNLGKLRLNMWKFAEETIASYGQSNSFPLQDAVLAFQPLF